MSTLTGPQRIAVEGLTPSQRIEYFLARNQGLNHDAAMAKARGTVGRVNRHPGHIFTAEAEEV
jgi:hypothetical protein